MDGQKAFLVIGITLVVVILLNLRILVSFRKRGNNPANLFQAFSSVIKRGRDPWTRDKENLAELSRRIEELQVEDQVDDSGEVN